MEDREIFPHVFPTELNLSKLLPRAPKDDRNCWSEGEGFGFSESSFRRMRFSSGRRSSGNLKTRFFLFLPLFFYVVAFSAAAHDSRWLSSRNLFSSIVRISSSDLQNRQNLDQNIQQAAFRQFKRHKTGRLYNVSVTGPGISGDSIFQAIRLRVGSFKKYGVHVNEFSIPRGCEVYPAPQRILLVYARVSNTSLFENLRGGLFLASPVVSVFAYDASNLNSTEQPDMLNVTSSTPISVQIQPLSSAASDLSCVSFDENSTNANYSVRLQGACDVNQLGAFALASSAPVNVSVPAPAMPPVVASFPNRSHQSSKAWKIAVGSVIGGLAVLAVAGALAFVVIQHRKNAKFAVMLHKADQGESLQTAVIRNSRAPAAGSTRTQPSLESEDAL